MVKEYKGAYSGEHGDGLVRSEWIEPVYGERLARAFGELKHAFDPKGLMNPGKIVAPPKMDDRSLFRFKPGYRTLPLATALDWSEHEVGAENRGRGFAAAVEMCNNNGHCRKFDAGTMCPSYRVTRDEQHVTRGRANSLRLALSGQLGPDGLASRAALRHARAVRVVQGLQARMPDRRRHGRDEGRVPAPLSRAPRRAALHDKLVAHLPRYARAAATLAPLMNLRDRVPGLAALSEKIAGFAARRSLPRWRSDWFRGQSEKCRAPCGRYRRRGAPRGRRAARRHLQHVLRARQPARCVARAARRAAIASRSPRRPTADGRSAAAARISRPAWSTRRAPKPRACSRRSRRTSRAALRSSGSSRRACSGCATSSARCCPALRAPRSRPRRSRSRSSSCASAGPGDCSYRCASRAFARALVHGHCHQKAFGAMPSVVAALKLVPGLAVETIASSCCGMAGAFGYQAKNVDVSLRDGRARAAARRAQRRRGHGDRRRRHELPASDPRRRAARRGARRARARRLPAHLTASDHDQTLADAAADARVQRGNDHGSAAASAARLTNAGHFQTASAYCCAPRDSSTP